jgi:hypothetical protein
MAGNGKKTDPRVKTIEVTDEKEPEDSPAGGAVK